MRIAFKICLHFLRVLNLSTSEKEKEVSKSYEAVVKSSSNLAIKRKDAHSVSIAERTDDEENSNSTRKSMQCAGETSRVTANGGASTSTSNFDRDNVKEKFQSEKVGGLCETKLKSSLKSAGEKNFAALLLRLIRKSMLLGIKIFVRLKNLEILEKNMNHKVT
ncbi:hypothetical protein V8G54_004194 [Vigna mungo]|uniref:Uncharacterized protein n=1 Tax=Vigna mungo TaxID=3915 RepID=A0AAQ3PBW6_VIGMU